MATFEDRPLAGDDLLGRVRTPLVQVPASGGVGVSTVNYAANSDGPWPRTQEEIDAQMTRLAAERAGVEQAPGGGDGRGVVMPRQAYVGGVWAAAQWTLAITVMAPMTFAPIPVDNASIRGQISAARLIRDSDGRRPQGHHARGVLAWFAWLAKAADTIDYPA